MASYRDTPFRKIKLAEYHKALEIVQNFANQECAKNTDGEISAFDTTYIFWATPRENRPLNEAIAKGLDLSWTGCPICGDFFGGHELLDNHFILLKGKNGRGVCYKESCGKKARKISDYGYED